MTTPLIPDSVFNKTIEVCRKSNTTSVYAANHHGMIFLLAHGEQSNGIVYRNDNLTYKQMKTLADLVNAILASTSSTPKAQHPFHNER